MLSEGTRPRFDVRQSCSTASIRAISFLLHTKDEKSKIIHRKSHDMLIESFLDAGGNKVSQICKEYTEQPHAPWSAGGGGGRHSASAGLYRVGVDLRDLEYLECGSLFDCKTAHEMNSKRAYRISFDMHQERRSGKRASERRTLHENGKIVKNRRSNVEPRVCEGSREDDVCEEDMQRDPDAFSFKHTMV
jgi:hypothetical protein